MPPPSSGAPPSQVSAEKEEDERGRREEATTPVQGCWLPGLVLVGGTGRGGNSQQPAGSQTERKALPAGLGQDSGLPGEGVLKTALGPQAEEGFWRLVPTSLGLIRNGGTVSAPPLGGQDRALGLGASWYMEDACALVPVVLGTGPKPHGPLFREAYGASGHCPLLSGKSGVMGGLGASSGFGLPPIGGPGLAPVTVTRTALAGLSGADGIREERGGGKSWVCLLLGGA